MPRAAPLVGAKERGQPVPFVPDAARPRPAGGGGGTGGRAPSQYFGRAASVTNRDIRRFVCNGSLSDSPPKQSVDVLTSAVRQAPRRPR